MRIIWLFLITCLIGFWPSASWSVLLFPDRYDGEFRQHSGRYLPGLDWQLLKAQCYQESLLRPDAVSPVGAQGLCQFMPGTWRQVSGQIDLPPNASAFMPQLSIRAAAFYMASLRGQWSSPRPEWDRHSLALGSYNAGLGNLLKAQKVCGGPVLYRDIVSCLPDVTGHHSRETLTYVDRIWRWYGQMIGGG